jgi:hypothetical protein
MSSDLSNIFRWTKEANIKRYKGLLDTKLTSVERNFIEQRLKEELSTANEILANEYRTDSKTRDNP